MELRRVQRSENIGDPSGSTYRAVREMGDQFEGPGGEALLCAAEPLTVPKSKQSGDAGFAVRYEEDARLKTLLMQSSLLDKSADAGSYIGGVFRFYDKINAKRTDGGNLGTRND